MHILGYSHSYTHIPKKEHKMDTTWKNSNYVNKCLQNAVISRLLGICGYVDNFKNCWEINILKWTQNGHIYINNTLEIGGNKRL